MAATTTNSLWYVYGIVPGDTSMTSIPGGIDDAGVSIDRVSDIAALVSVLDGDEYSPSAIERASGDVEWLSPRAVAHDRVLTWASDHGAVIPLPMFSLFSGEDAVHRMLGDRGAQLGRTLSRIAKGREYALRVYRVDAEFAAAVVGLSPRLTEMARTAGAASAGQRYLLERKLEAERKTEMRSVTRQLVDEIVEELSRSALGVNRVAIPKAPSADGSRGTMILNAAYLVAPSAFEAFQRTLTALVQRHSGYGFRFDFTGPWPPYHFVDDNDGAQ
ncbi:MAG TPA: GvpL/GvpF family gas vesicle protein [Casimicrobiaceae bacterium]|nr:GvpL/GvpF family gas vesicle protein [Casimicrobiaceae bacterium]